jgi:ferrous iron transport protein B
VANYPGVTVEKHLGWARLPTGGQILLVDLPGINGFSARTQDERVTRDVLSGNAAGLKKPDALVLTVDCTRLEPQLMLVEPVLAMDVPTLLVLTMADELEAGGGAVDEAALEADLGVAVVRVNARQGTGVERVRAFLQKTADGSLAAPARSPTPPPHPGRPADDTPPARRVDLPVVDVFVNRRGRVRVTAQRAGFRAPLPHRWTQRLDAVFLHRVAGPLVFLAVVALVFQAIFTWATPAMDLVEFLVTTSGEWLAAVLPAGWLRSLLIDGVWMGVGAVLVFLPQILVLFLFIGLLEDSGYMARAAVIADRSMYRVGLQGRAFLPLLSAFACAVPAILAARTVEDERDRLATIFVAPFMTCSARLPVYALLIAAFIPERPLLGPFLGTRAATLLGLYALGAVAAVLTAFALKRTLLRGGRSSFVMELPPYRLPTLRSIALRLVDRSGIFLKRVGRIILAVTVILWALSQFPRVDGAPPPIGESALGRMGQVIEPAIAPLGFDWRIGVGLVSSLAAREVIVGTLGTIYGVEDATEESREIQDTLKRDLDFDAAVGLMIFFAFALQCTSTIAVMRRETAGWKWPALQWGYMLILAYGGAYLARIIL